MSAQEPQLTGVDDLLAPTPRRYKVLTLPISGKVVRIRSLTERESAEYQAAATRVQGGQPMLRADRLKDAARRFIVLCLVDSAGNRILNDTHVLKLAEWDAADVQFLWEECSAHVGLKASDLEALVKNSESAPAAS
jgi:hypothetical protein